MSSEGVIGPSLTNIKLRQMPGATIESFPTRHSGAIMDTELQIITREKLVADMRTVLADTEQLLKAVIGQSGEKLSALQPRSGIAQIFLDPRLQRGQLFARLADHGLEQLFGVGEHGTHIRDQFFAGDDLKFGVHDGSRVSCWERFNRSPWHLSQFDIGQAGSNNALGAHYEMRGYLPSCSPNSGAVPVIL